MQFPRTFKPRDTGTGALSAETSTKGFWWPEAKGGVAPAWQLWALHACFYMCMYMYVWMYGCLRIHICFCLCTCIVVYAFIWTHAHIDIDMYVWFSFSFWLCASPPWIYALTSLSYCLTLCLLLSSYRCVCYSNLPIPSFSIHTLTNFLNQMASNPFHMSVCFPISPLLSSSSP